MNVLKKMNSEEVKNSVNFSQEKVYLVTESCLMSLCNILKDAAHVIRKASTLKTGKSKFRSDMIISAVPTRKKLKEAYAVIGTGDPLSGKKSIFKIGNLIKKNNCRKKRRKHTPLIKYQPNLKA